MTIEQLNELNIFALREIARRVGVSSPTSKVKNVLINEIIEISNGRQMPAKTSGKGRPPKSSIINTEEVFSFASGDENFKKIVLKQNRNLSENVNLFNVEGYVEIVNENASFLWLENKNNRFIKYYIPIEDKNNLNLRTGDFVEASAYLQENQLMIEKVLKVNGVEADKIINPRNCYDSLEHVFPTEIVNFENNKTVNVMYGENAYLYGVNNNQNTQTIVNLLNSCLADVKIYLNLSMADKNRIYLNLLKDCEILVSNLTEEKDYAKKVAVMAIERAKRMFELGKKVVIAVDDMLSISSIDKEEMIISKKLMSVAKCTDSAGISVIAVMPKNFDIFILEKLVDKRFEILKSGEIINEVED